MILEGVFQEGTALPSVRQVASDHRINPLTVSKAYQLLVELELVEKRRGLGMFVVEGALEKLKMIEKEKFLHDEWPLVAERVALLDLSIEELLKALPAGGKA